MDNAARLDALLDLVGATPAAVFWGCPAGEAALYKHLRLINGAVVPLPTEAAQARREEAEALGEPFAPLTSDYTDERVLFRHYDSRVLAQVLPVLDERQFAQVLGAAAMVVIPAEGGGSPLRAPALDPPAIAPNGTLLMRPEQMEAISHTRVEQSRRTIMGYLREVAPDQTRGIGDRRLYQGVVHAETTARHYGVRNEDAIARWAYMLATCPDDFTQDWAVRRFMRAKDLDATPDQRVQMLFDARKKTLAGKS